MPDTRIFMQMEPERHDDEMLRDLVWPTMIPDEDPSLRGLQVTFFRGDTMRDGDGWKLVPEWCGEPESKGTASLAESETGIYRFKQVDVTWVYRGNDFLVHPSVIESQYGPGNPDRWNRMPLTGVNPGRSGGESHRDSDKRWKHTDNMDSQWSAVNLRCTLKRKADEAGHKFDTGPDLYLDDEQTGRWSIRPDSLRYKIRPSSPGRYGIQIQEIGTKTFCHYVNQEDFVNGGPIGYAAEWLEPEGILYSPFDTSDSHEFKVTREPRFAADEISGLFLDLKRRNRVEIYLMPRRWAFYTYHSVAQSSTDLGEVLVVENCIAHRDAMWTECLCPADPYTTENECKWHQDCNFVDFRTWGGVLVDCAGECTAEGTYWSLYDWCCRSYKGTNTYHFSEADGCGYDGDLQLSQCMPGGGTCIDSQCLTCTCTRDVASQRTIAFDADLYEETINVCLWWDSPPLDFKLRGPKEKTSPVTIYHWTGEAYTPSDLTFIGDESLADAADHADAAGGDPDALIGGYNSIHTMGSSCWTQIRVTRQVPGYYWTRWNLLFNAPDFQPFQWDEATGIYLGVFDWDDDRQMWMPSAEDCMTQIWLHMERSTFFQSEFPGGAHGEIGVGISPNKAGTLCAVVKIGAKVFFVWRRTDEQFITRDLQLAGPAFEKPLVSFVPRSPSSGHYGGFDFWQHFHGEGRKLTHILRNKHVECARESDYGIDRSHAPGEGNVTTFIVNDSGPGGAVALEMPVYLIAAKERAPEHQPLAYKVLMQSLPGGAAISRTVANQY
ncbi:MAG: hypothetical protein RDU20_22755 [Desulfomonilaceae bacterium]|nr:hypothetical protein [Desulfomonilaceae bacterium]